MGWLFAYRAAGNYSLLMNRLLLIFFFLFPAFWAGSAFADYPKVFLYYEGTTYHMQSADYNAICQNFTAQIKAKYPNEADAGSSCYETSAHYTTYYVGYNYYRETINKYGSCNGVVSLWGNGICTGNPPTCTAPQVYNSTTGTCETPCVAGCNGACGSYYSVTGSAPSSACIDGCSYRVGDSIESSTGGAVFLVGNNTGQKCTASSASPSPPSCPECDCLKKGMTYGTVNGAVVCTAVGTPNTAPIKTSSSSTSSSTTTSKDSSGNTTGTSTNAETKTESTTINKDGTATTTTTTTTTNPDGTQQVSQSEKTESLSDYCKNNPAAPLCTQKTDCDKNPDSIACQEKNSFFNQLKSTIFGSLESDVNGLGNGDGLIPKSSVNLEFTKVDLPQSNSCPPPVTFSIGGRGISISYDWLCEYAESFRPVVIAFAYMAAIMIIFGAIRKDN